MNEHLRSAVNLLNLVRQETEVIGCAVSFGKDSLATLDLCWRLFRRVEAYYLFRVRGLEIVKDWAEAVKKRTGVKVRMYPHFDLCRCYNNNVLQPHFKNLRVPKIGMKDIERIFRRDAKVEWIAYGWRRNDSCSRALILKTCRGYDPKTKRIFPLRGWRRSQVYDYLRQRDIEIPPGLGRKDQGGLDFHPGALQELRDKHPADWQRWLRDFPFAEAMLLEIPTDSGGLGKQLDS